MNDNESLKNNPALKMGHSKNIINEISSKLFDVVSEVNDKAIKTVKKHPHAAMAIGAACAIAVVAGVTKVTRH